MSAPLTYAECLARLASCEPMARGERMSCVTRLRVATQWCRMYWASMLPQDRMMRDWRAYAAPLRRAREERQKWKERALADCSVMEWLISRISDEDLAHLIARLKDGE